MVRLRNIQIFFRIIKALLCLGDDILLIVITDFLHAGKTSAQHKKSIRIKPPDPLCDLIRIPHCRRVVFHTVVHDNAQDLFLEECFDHTVLHSVSEKIFQPLFD